MSPGIPGGPGVRAVPRLAGDAAGRRAAAGLLSAGLCGAGCVAWAAVPQVHQGAAGFALFLAILGVAAGVLRLALSAVPAPEESYLLPAARRAWLMFLETLRLVPWEEGALAHVP